MSHASVLVDEIANELDGWPGVRVERRPDGTALARYEELELGVLDPGHGTVRLRLPGRERDDLLEPEDPETADSLPDFETVSHDVHGPSDVTAVLELFDRRYRDLRGEDAPYSSQDPD